jgi:UPF0755 protein
MKRITALAVGIFVAAGILLAGAIYIGAAQWRMPAAVEVDIPPGSSVRSIATLLGERHAIGTPKLFELWARLRGLNRKLRAGTYEFPAGATMADVMDRVVRGEVKQFEFRVLEGWNISDIAAALAGQPFLADATVPERFLELVRDPSFIASLGFQGLGSLEGYLFPDTYLLMRPTTAEQLVKRMVARYREVWSSLVPPGTMPPRNEREIVILASIVERETGAAAERPRIAGVFENRLKLGMPLQSDPTIIYGLPNFDGNIHKQDIQNPHPYNTYVHKGLPPGAICNPGKASLEAALHPAASEFIYFVARGDGTHQFSATQAEHILAVQKFQIEPSRRP